MEGRINYLHYSGLGQTAGHLLRHGRGCLHAIYAGVRAGLNVVSDALSGLPHLGITFGRPLLGTLL
jgi:hypothetical protein